MTAPCPGPLVLHYAGPPGNPIGLLIECESCDYVLAARQSGTHDEAHASTPWKRQPAVGGAS